MKKKCKQISLLNFDELGNAIITSYDSLIDEEAYEIFKNNLLNSKAAPTFMEFLNNPFLDGKDNPSELTMTKIKYLYDYLTKRKGGISFHSTRSSYTRIDFDSHLKFEERCSLVQEYLNCCHFRKNDEVEVDKLKEIEEKLRSFPDSPNTTLYLRKLIDASDVASKLFNLLNLDLELDKEHSLDKTGYSLMKKRK